MIQLKEVSKSYKKNQVLKNISLQVQPGQIYCILGKNGAGKTTLINSILNLVQIDTGEITLFDTPNSKLNAELKKKIGIVGDQLALIEEISGRDFLNLCAQIYAIPKIESQKRITDLVNIFFSSENDLKLIIRKYSTGMKKKLAFCAALIHAPQLLILDEPFSGLDPLVINQLIEFLAFYKNANRSILLSSHNLSYIDKISTHIAVLDEGNFAFNGTINEFTQAGSRQISDALLEFIKPGESAFNTINWL